MIITLLLIALAPTFAVPSPTAPIPLVVIDPGHGGKQTGAIGPCNLKEKDLTLEISTRVARMLHTTGKVKVLLTRTTDRDVELDHRSELANQVGASLFLSIHANASKDSSRHGVETYFLSHTSSNRRIARTVSRENRAFRKTGRKKGNTVSQILSRMEQNSNHQQSQQVAIHFEDHIKKSMSIKGRGVFQAPFMVLLKARMPALLVEMGFITNTRECRRFKQDQYQEQMAQALTSGILSYLANNPSPEKPTTASNNY